MELLPQSIPISVTPVAGRASIVSCEDWCGVEWYCVTDVRTLFEAVRNATRFFADPLLQTQTRARTRSLP